jgi:RNA polymerase sigma factor (sigma-70 family)
MTENELKDQFIDVLEKHIGIILKISGAYAYVKQDREDLIHDIIFELWKSFKRFDGSCKISTWIYRVALNISMNYKRRMADAIKFSSLNDFNEEDIALWFEEEDNSTKMETLYHCIDKLNEINKVIILLYLDGNSHDEISEITGISRTNVGTRISRIKEQLKYLVISKNE